MMRFVFSLFGPPFSDVRSYLQLPPRSPTLDRSGIANERGHGGIQLDTRRAQLRCGEPLLHTLIENRRDIAKRAEHGNAFRQMTAVVERLLALFPAERVIARACGGPGSV